MLLNTVCQQCSYKKVFIVFYFWLFLFFSWITTCSACRRISITFRRMDESKRPVGFAPEPDLEFDPTARTLVNSQGRSHPPSTTQSDKREVRTSGAKWALIFLVDIRQVDTPVEELKKKNRNYANRSHCLLLSLFSQLYPPTSLPYTI